MKFLKSKSFWLLTVAVVCGVGASVSAKKYIQEQLAIEKARIAPNQTLVEVVVAKADLRVGQTVDQHNMAVRSIPVDYVSGQAVKPERFDAVVGAKLATAIKAGEVLLRSSVTGADVATFSSRIRPGVRALTIAVDDVNSISGMLQPGDRIDLLFSTKNPAAPQGVAAQLNGDVTVPLMHNVAVLATGKQLRPGDDGKAQRAFTTVTIEADTLQAQRLVVAQRAGKLTALLRNPEDREPMRGAVMDLGGLLAMKVQNASVAPASVGPQVIIGGQRLPEASQRLAVNRPPNETLLTGLSESVHSVPSAASVRPEPAAKAQSDRIREE